ncbi:MAG: hypothetical protein L0287_10850 [Anaerolineae bacterium]|nr:hypothetical protein [Anaerolineae bacterium]
MELRNHSSPEKQARLQMLIDLVVRFMPLEKWGFKQSVHFFSEYRPDVLFPSGKGAYPTVIYDSEHSRVKFLLDRERYGDELIVYYGRLHAPNDKGLINWNGEDCYCWHSHNIDLALKFLDGISPKEVAKKRWEPPRGSQEFVKLSLERTIGQPESMARRHAVIWEYYGHRLFNLFDLHRSDLWTQYARFVKEYYDLFGRAPNVTPSFDKIC